jgi:3-hydroxybutyryl-CoA dehydrogenase
MHFFNPPQVMQLIEVIRGMKTSDETFEAVSSLAKEIGKTPVEVKEAPGFVVNRLLIPMINEAVCLFAEGVASAESIDTAMRLGANHPMGPLALGDLIGLDVVLAIMDTLFEETKDTKYRAHPLLRKMVRAGTLGRKTSRGFFAY